VRACCEGGQGVAFRMNQPKQPNVICYKALLLHPQWKKIRLESHVSALNEGVKFVNANSKRICLKLDKHHAFPLS
jgi:hypothetical protein